MIYNFIVLLCIFFCIYNVQGMEAGLTIYQQQCRGITQEINQEKKQFLCDLLANKLDPRAELMKINKQFIKYSDDLYQEEQKALLAIKKRYVDSDEQWDCYMETLDCIKDELRQQMALPILRGIHDTTIHPVLMATMQEWLKIHDINPVGVHIINSLESLVDKSIIAGARGPDFSCVTSIDNQHRLLVTIQTIPSIVLFSSFNDYSLVVQKSMCIHETWHIIAMHPPMQTVIPFFVKHENEDLDDVKNSAEFLNLNAMYEKQAEICPALISFDASSCMKSMRAIASHDEMNAVEEHYRDLCAIKALWKKRRALEEYLTLTGF